MQSAVPLQNVPTQDWTLTLGNGNGWQTGPEYRNVTDPDVRAGHVASELVLLSRGSASTPGSTGMGGAGEKPNAPVGWTPNATVALEVPVFLIGNSNPLWLSAG